jgi:hypothetical protein
VAVVVAIVVCACASLAAFEVLSGEHSGLGSAQAVATGVPPAISPLSLSKVDAAADAARLFQTRRTRAPRGAALVGFGVCLFLVTRRGIAFGAGHGSSRRALLASASSRAPPRRAMTLS